MGPDPHADYATALQWITEGRIDVRPMITHLQHHQQMAAAHGHHVAEAQTAAMTGGAILVGIVFPPTEIPQ